MFRSLTVLAVALLAANACLLTLAPPAAAQPPVIVSGYGPVQPILTYFPERHGLFGQRTVYKPVVTYSMPSPPPMLSVPALPSPAPVTAYYAPLPTVVRAPAPVMVAPPPVVVAPAPVIVARPVAPVIVVPPPVLTPYPPVFLP